MANIFISYAHQDREIALKIERALKTARHEGWLEKHKVLGGGEYRLEIEKALKSCHTVLALMSPEARRSEYVTYEWAFALGAGARVVPVLVKKTKVHRRLEPLQYVDLSSSKKNWRHLIEAVGKDNRKTSANNVERVTRARPSVIATFDMDGDRPARIGRSYKICVGTKNVPKGTEVVRYEILDESFDDNKFSAKWGQGDYEESITSWGDVFVTAKGRGDDGEWRVKTRLSEALRRGYRGSRRIGKSVRKALHAIENN